jgi:predicted dinucleotide-binding enzyme
MSTAIIGVGNIGRTIAGHLVAGGEGVVLAARETPDQLAKQLGDLASATTVPEGIDAADMVVLAVWLDVMKGLIEHNLARLARKVVVDPSNPVALNEKGEITRTLPEGVSSGSVVARLLPPTTHFVKAFGTLSAGSLEKAANRTPQRAALFYATDDVEAQATIERLISISGFDPVKAGGRRHQDRGGRRSERVWTQRTARGCKRSPGRHRIPQIGRLVDRRDFRVHQGGVTIRFVPTSMPHTRL